MVDGHSAHGADSRRTANTDSSAARRRRYGQVLASVPDSLSRSRRKHAGSQILKAIRREPEPSDLLRDGSVRGFIERRQG